MQPFGNMDGVNLDVIMDAHARARSHGYVKGAKVFVFEKGLVGTVVGFNFNKYMLPLGSVAPLIIDAGDIGGKCPAEVLLLIKDGMCHDPFGRMPDMPVPKGGGTWFISDDEDWVD